MANTANFDEFSKRPVQELKKMDSLVDDSHRHLLGARLAAVAAGNIARPGNRTNGDLHVGGTLTEGPTT